MKPIFLFFCSSVLSMLVLAIMLGSGTGCARKPNDAKISGDIQNRFSQDSGLSTKQLTVQSVNGTVTLSGTVDNTAQREAASRQAAAEPGVKEVVNNLVVGTAPDMVVAFQPRNAPSAPPAESKPEAGKTRRTSSKHHPRTTENSADNSAADSNNDQESAAAQPPAEAPPTPAPPTESASNAPAPAMPRPPKRFIIDQGASISVRLVDPIDSEKNQVGDTFHATLNAPLDSDGEEVVPAGTQLTGHVVDVRSASKFAGKSLVVLQLDTLSQGGKQYPLQTDQYRKEGSSRSKSTAEKVGGGAVLGTIIGAVAGGGKGAAIGAAAGAGAGGAVQAATKSEQIKLLSETVLNFILQQPISVLQAPPPDNRQKLPDNSQ